MCRHTYAGYLSDRLRRQSSTYTPVQRAWLNKRYPVYIEHHDRKALPQFFPSLYEEFFSEWPLRAPTEDEIEAAKDDMAIAVVGVRKLEEHVSEFYTDRRSPG